jgi:hypothetical protein
MSAALVLVETVKANGGLMRVEGDSLVIAPDSAALLLMDELLQHKEEIIRLLQSSLRIPADDPDSWRGPFARWINSACIFHQRAFGGVAALHLAYCEWEIEHGGVPYNRETFVLLLEECGLLIGEVDGLLLVSGLTFRNDLEAAGF